METRYVIDKEMGTKWFTFFTKVRPWIICTTCFFSLISYVIGIFPYIQYIQQNALAFLCLFAISEVLFGIAATYIVLSIMTFVKSKSDYLEFANFVNKVLIFEECVTVCVFAANQWLENGFLVAIISATICGIIGHYLWYKVNSNYFYNRVKIFENDEISPALEEEEDQSMSLSSPGDKFEPKGKYGVYGYEAIKQDTSEYASFLKEQDIVPEKANNGRVRYCSQCGKVINPDTKKCTGCGRQYFKAPSPQTVLTILLFALIIVSVVLNILLIISNVNMKNYIASLECLHYMNNWLL